MLGHIRRLQSGRTIVNPYERALRLLLEKRAGVTVETVHRIARDKNINIETPRFKDMCREITGKRHLDEMSAEELLQIARRFALSYEMDANERQAAIVRYGLTKTAAVTALGIPDRRTTHPITEKPGAWEYLESRHLAHRAGAHTDVRLAGSAHAHSWAVRRMPEPGEKVLAKQQPTHTRRYMDWQGVIPKGQYGGGSVTTVHRGKAEVVDASPDKIVYAVHSGQRTKEYALIRTQKSAPNDWLFLNTSTQHGKYPLPKDKPRYREVPFSPALADRPGLLMPKVDGAHALMLLQPGKRPRAFSYRTSKRGDPLEYTHKIPGLFGQRVPDDVKRQILRGEVFLADEKGHAMPSEQTAGLLNSGVEKARAAQNGHQLKFMPFDIIGDKRPASDRLAALQELAGRLKGLHPPEGYSDTEGKQRLLQSIRSGKHPLTREGVVHFPEGHVGGEGPVKAKLVADADVYVKGVFPGKGRIHESAGGFTYSRTPDGPVVGKVGTGLSDAQRHFLWQHRNELHGRVAKVSYDKETGKGALYGPRFAGWHVDKNLRGAS